MSSPTFLIIGGPKSGTTSLANWLTQHPEIYLAPLKECCYFALNGRNPSFKGPGDDRLNRRLIWDRLTYLQLFSEVKEEKAVGEASVWYLYVPSAAARIRNEIPDARLIVLLRNPVERAFSSYMMTRREGREPCGTLAEALLLEESRIKNNWEYVWHYRKAGLYCSQLSRYLEQFSRTQINIHLYDDLKESPACLVKSIFEFLEVDAGFMPDLTAELNRSGIPRSKRLHRFLNKPSRSRKFVKMFVPPRTAQFMKRYVNRGNLDRPILDDETRSTLTKYYRDDILRLGDLIKRDLSQWLLV